MKKSIIYLLISFFVFSCYEESAVPVTSDFSYEYLEGNKSTPVQVRITNRSEGAEAYEWTFEGGTPASSDKKEPGVITYENPGEYTITLTVSNQDGSTDTKKMPIQIYEGINIDFTTQIVNNQANYPPVEVQIDNKTEGIGLTYNWSFEGGVPATSTEQNPPNVIFSAPGEHKITLTVHNGTKNDSKTQIITVAENIVSDFSWNVSLFDDDYQAPVTLNMVNNSTNATSCVWSFEGGIPATSTEKEPVVVYKTPGTYTIRLKSDNGSSTVISEKQLTIYPDTNLRVFKDVKMGINSAHNNNLEGAFFSTLTHKVYTANEVNTSVGKDIDLVFFGLNSQFNYNKFISPDIAIDNGFSSIPNATHTVFVNSQELCNCGLTFSLSEFNTMADDIPLRSLNIVETPGGLQQFNNSLPRVVLFKTEDGRKGAISVNQMIANGAGSYIVCDIKVQKVSK